MTDRRRVLSKISKEAVSSTVGDRTRVRYVEKVVFESVVRCVVTVLVQDLITMIH
jgi:hypothetical protein